MFHGQGTNTKRSKGKGVMHSAKRVGDDARLQYITKEAQIIGQQKYTSDNFQDENIGGKSILIKMHYL